MSKPMSEQMQKVAERYERATGKKFSQMTNADHIRSMTDEELAGFLSPTFSCYGCPARTYCERDEIGVDCNELVASWLKQPYKEDT